MKMPKDFYVKHALSPAEAAAFPFLYVLSLVFGLAVRLRRFLYARGWMRSYRAAARVISVGNITVGGSGKTPLVAYVAARLGRGPRRIAVLLRGYRRPTRPGTAGTDRYYVLGDEGSMLVDILGDKIPVLAAVDRARVVRRLDRESATDVLVLDDGFQHLKLKRDLDIVTVDATRPFGNGCLLPAGPLREEVSSLKRADVLCLTRCDEVADVLVDDLAEVLRFLNPTATVVRSVHRPTGFFDPQTHKQVDRRTLQGMSVGLFCGIAHPASFEKSVLRFGARVVFARSFDDHHVFSASEIEAVQSDATARGAQALITTQKDFERLARLVGSKSRPLKVYVWQVSLEIIDGYEALDARLALI